jgi:hypothetical protein
MGSEMEGMSSSVVSCEPHAGRPETRWKWRKFRVRSAPASPPSRVAEFTQMFHPAIAFLLEAAGQVTRLRRLNG